MQGNPVPFPALAPAENEVSASLYLLRKSFKQVKGVPFCINKDERFKVEFVENPYPVRYFFIPIGAILNITLIHLVPDKGFGIPRWV